MIRIKIGKEIKEYLVVTVAILMILGCAPKIIKPMTYPMNVDLIAESIRKIELPSGSISTGQTVALVNVESVEDVDLPVNYLIADQLIQNVMKTGATVMERHPRLIKKLISESKDEYVLFNQDSTIQETSLSAADRIIAFRVLECGLEYTPLEGGTVMRQAYTSLHLRVEDAKTGQILWLGTLEGKATDQVPIEVVGNLNARRLVFYKHGLPNQQFLESEGR